MHVPNAAPDERARLAALNALSILDTPREAEFDRLAQLAATALRLPIALISFIDADRVWVKASYGIRRVQTPRTQALCALTLESAATRAPHPAGVIVLRDIHDLQRFATDPDFARCNDNVRFYAAAPLVTPDGHQVGALCVMAPEPRDVFGPVEASLLADLAAVVQSALESRRERLHRLRLSAELALLNDIHSVLIDTTSFEAALAATIRRLLEATAGTYCQVWEKREGEAVAHPLAFVIRNRAEDALFDALRVEQPMSLAELWVGELLAGSGDMMAITFAGDAQRFPVIRHAQRLGVGGMIACRLDVGDRRFALAICCRGQRTDLPELAELVGRLAQVIRPVLLRKQTEEHLVDTARRLRDLSEKLIRAERIAQLGRWRWVVGSSIVEWSDTIYTMYGETPERFTPSMANVTARLHPDDREATHRDVARAVTHRIGYKHEYRIRRPDGSQRDLWSDAVCEHGPDGEVLALHGIIQDITERKEAEAMLLQAEKLRSIGQLTGGIAHDFNNLLMVISVNLELVGAMLGPDHPAEEARAMAFHAAANGAQLTASLLAFARRQKLQPRMCDVNALLGAMHALALSRLGEGYAIRLVLQPDLPPCLLDQAGFESAMLNLLVNSRDAMPSGGVITIETGARQVWAAWMAGRRGLAPGDYVTVAVHDCGHGIPEHLQERVFEPFFTTKPLGHGTGLGLSTVIGFVRQSGGEVELLSKEGGGTTIRLLLPVSEAKDVLL